MNRAGEMDESPFESDEQRGGQSSSITSINLPRGAVNLALRRQLLGLLVQLGVLPSDTLLMYDKNAFNWFSGFGEFANVLYSLVRSAKPQTIVEVGSAYGYSTCYIAAALQRNGFGKLYSIDPHEPTRWNDGNPAEDTFVVVRDRLKKLRLSQYVCQIREYSQHALAQWDQPIDMLLLDGSHSYEDVKRDFFGFLPHVANAGLVLFHDTMWEYHRDSKWYRSDQGVPKLVQELQENGYPMITLREGWGLTILQNSKGGFPLIPSDDQHTSKRK